MNKKIIILYDVNTKEAFDEITQHFKNNGFYFVGEFPGHNITFEEAKSFYRRNAKIKLQPFYNTITGRKEIQITTAAIEKTYPQNKDAYFMIFTLDDARRIWATA